MQKTSGYLNIQGGTIKSITAAPTESSVEDFSHCTIVPGFIDIHTHGYGGIDSMTRDVSQLLEWSREITSHGVTGIVPSSVSESPERIVEFIGNIKKAMGRPLDGGAEILGCRLEGPFISIEKRGAHNLDSVRDPVPEEVSNILRVGEEVLRIVDIAPEIPGGIEAISEFTKSGVIASGAHSDSSFEEVTGGVDHGVSLLTHFYNAMSELRHRNVGMVGAGLLDERLKIELIADLIHVSPEAIKLAVKCRGWENIILVTDSISATGLGDGAFKLGNINVQVRDGLCTVMGSDTIAGSTLTLDRAIRNLMGLGYSLEEVIPSSSSIPANLLGFTDRGLLSPGYRADICVLDDDATVEATYVKGQAVYRK